MSNSNNSSYNKKHIDDDNSNSSSNNKSKKYKHDKHNQRSANIMTSDIQTAVAATTTTTIAAALATGASGRGHAMVTVGATQAAQVVTQRHSTSTTTATTTTTTMPTDTLIVEDIDDDDDDDGDIVTLAYGTEPMVNVLPVGIDGNGNGDCLADAHAVGGGDVDGEVGDGSDSCASMETLSDNVSIWIDGEKHWISGVDANTTCADLICALLNYQQLQPTLPGEQQLEQEQQQQQRGGEIEQDQKRQQRAAIIEGSTNANTTNKHQQWQHRERSNKAGNNAINQSTRRTKEDFKGNCISGPGIGTGPGTSTSTGIGIGTSKPTAHRPPAAACVASNDYVIVKQLRHCEEYLDGNAKVFDVLPARDTLARKECELLLRHLIAPRPMHKSNAAKVSSLLSTDKDSGMGSPVGSSRSARLRRRKHKSNFGSAAAVLASNWLAQANTLHPKSTSALASASASTANERLMKIILAQDETIHRQLSMLREKERQILKIEEEKHRVRERELGKNYLLETYLNALDEADANVNAFAGASPLSAHAHSPALADVDVGVDADANAGVEHELEQLAHDFDLTPDLMHGVEIFIDEPYQRNQQQRPRSERQALTMHAYGAGDGSGNGNRAAGTDVAITETKTTTTVAAGVGVSASANKDANIDLQLYWLEKVYAVNKQLQREEELLLKLTAKIRKHQVKRAYQTKTEVLQQIDKLDEDLATQVHDIRGVERKLLSANEQLKAKLGVLECLSQEFEVEADKETLARNATELVEVVVTNVSRVPEDVLITTTFEIKAKPLPPPPPLPPSTQPMTFERHPSAHLAYTQLQNANDLLQLQRLIEKPAEHDETLQLLKAPTEQLILAKNTRPVQLSDAKSVKKQMFAYGTELQQQQQQQQQPSQSQSQPTVGLVNKQQPLQQQQQQQQQQQHAHNNITTTAAIVHTWQPTLPLPPPPPPPVPVPTPSQMPASTLIATPILSSLPARHDIANLGTLV